MAAMEKISNPQLIEALSQNSALYNQWYREGEIKYGNLPAQAIANWMVEVVEPIVKAAFDQNSAPEKVHEVVKTLYLESLKLVGSGLAIRYREEYKAAWLLLVQMPNLIVKFPIKVLTLLNDVLLNLQLHAPEKSIAWCNLMTTSSSAINTIEDLKTVGRIYAWKCGLAHLRIRLKTDYEALAENLQQTVVDTIGLSKNSQLLFETPWTNTSTQFQGVLGGFKGTTGFFEHPPKLAQLDQHLLVTDTKNSYAFFADQFGKVLLPATTVAPSYILSKSKQFEILKTWLEKYKEEIDPSTISSVVVTKDTLAFTLENSYFLYLFSHSNE